MLIYRKIKVVRIRSFASGPIYKHGPNQTHYFITSFWQINNDVIPSKTQPIGAKLSHWIRSYVFFSKKYRKFTGIPIESKIEKLTVFRLSNFPAKFCYFRMGRITNEWPELRTGPNQGLLVQICTTSTYGRKDFF